jgi:hypothetical protein
LTRHTAGAVDLVRVGETGQVGDKKEIEKELDIGRFFVMLKLRVLKERLIVGFDRDILVSREMLLL